MGKRTYVNPRTFRHPAVIPVLRNGVIIVKLVNYDGDWGRRQSNEDALGFTKAREIEMRREQVERTA